MIGQDGRQVTYDDLKTISTPLSEEINKRLKPLGFEFNGYVIDGELSASVSEIGNDSYYGKRLFYIDRFLADDTHAQIRYVPSLDIPKSSWCNNIEEAKEVADSIRKQVEVYEWLCEQDFSQLYHAYEKDVPELPKGNFDLSDRDIRYAGTRQMVEYIQNLYQTDEHFLGHGYKSDDRTIVITTDAQEGLKDGYHYNYDLHIFPKDQEPYTIKHIADDHCFSVVDVLADNGRDIEISLCSHVHSGHKCTDKYCSCSTIHMEDDCAELQVSPFVFLQRYSERGGPALEDKEIDGYSFVFEGEDLTQQEALELSKELGCENVKEEEPER